MSESVNINSEEFISKYNNIINNLKIISEIKPYDKLYIQNKNLYIDYSLYVLQSIIRWVYYINRNDGINYIKSIIKNVLKLKEQLTLRLNQIKKKLKKSKFRTTIRLQIKNNLINYINTINKELKLNIKGLENLKITYSDDNEYIASINLIINDINNT